MPQTKLTIDGEKFRINGALTYTEIPTCKPSNHGLLMNSRMIQGIFDSPNQAQFQRYGKEFCPERNTDELIAALPAWYAKGLRAITVGMQGGGACYTIDSSTLRNTPYSADGTQLDAAYLARLDRLITACDAIGMIVIVSYFYCSNINMLDGAQAIINATEAMSCFLKEKGYTNVIIEIANEYDIVPYENVPLIHSAQGMVALMHLAKRASGGMPVGCSGGGGSAQKEVCAASDVVLLHGNELSRSRLYNMILQAKEYAPNRPIVINEDSQAIGQLKVCDELSVSWGYYNNMTKQEPPTYWEITKGEDTFFAWRMADMLGITQEEVAPEEQYYLQGFEPHMHCKGERFPRVAALHPESIDFVRFYCNDVLQGVCYDECFTLNFCSNWQQLGVITHDSDVWTAEINLRNGEIITRTAVVHNA